MDCTWLYQAKNPQQGKKTWRFLTFASLNVFLSRDARKYSNGMESSKPTYILESWPCLVADRGVCKKVRMHEQHLMALVGKYSTVLIVASTFGLVALPEDCHIRRLRCASSSWHSRSWCHLYLPKKTRLQFGCVVDSLCKTAEITQPGAWGWKRMEKMRMSLETFRFLLQPRHTNLLQFWRRWNYRVSTVSNQNPSCHWACDGSSSPLQHTCRI